jgi:hypothetical protein
MAAGTTADTAFGALAGEFLIKTALGVPWSSRLARRSGSSGTERGVSAASVSRRSRQRRRGPAWTPPSADERQPARLLRIGLKPSEQADRALPRRTTISIAQPVEKAEGRGCLCPIPPARAPSAPLLLCCLQDSVAWLAPGASSFAVERSRSPCALPAQRGCTSSTAKTPDATAKGGLLTGEGADVS